MLLHHVVNVHRSAFEHSLADHHPPGDGHPGDGHRDSVRRRDGTEVGHQREHLAGHAVEEGIVGAAKARGSLDDSVEHGLEIGRRGRDGAEDLAGSRLLLECLGKIMIAGL